MAEETTNTDKYIGFSAVDIHALAEALNNFVEDGGTITSVIVCGDKIVNALVLGSEPEDDD